MSEPTEHQVQALKNLARAYKASFLENPQVVTIMGVQIEDIPEDLLRPLLEWAVSSYLKQGEHYRASSRRQLSALTATGRWRRGNK